MKTIIFVLVICLISCDTNFKLSAIKAHQNTHDRQPLSHACVAIEAYKNQSTKVKRHSLQHELADYEQNALETNHHGFLLPLTIDGIVYKMSMDTGSSDIFIKGESAPGVPQIRYKSKQNYKRKPKIMIGYLDGDLKTYQATLDVQFNGNVIETPLLVAYTAGPQFENIQGLIGLSYPSIARHQPTFIQTLIQNKIISKYAYGMNLNLIQDNRSFISFGSPDTELYEGDLKEYPLLTDGYSKQIAVEFTHANFGVGNKMQIKKALLDTGNTCISIPRRFESEMLKQLNTKSNKCAFMVETNIPIFSLLICKIGNFDELPTLTLSFDGSEDYIISKQFYLQKCTKQSNKSKQYYCDTYIQSVEYPGTQMIFLGDAFFNRFYTYFDLEQEKVGIAKNKENITLNDIFSLRMDYEAADWVDLDL